MWLARIKQRGSNYINPFKLPCKKGFKTADVIGLPLLDYSQSNHVSQNHFSHHLVHSISGAVICVNLYIYPFHNDNSSITVCHNNDPLSCSFGNEVIPHIDKVLLWGFTALEKEEKRKSSPNFTKKEKKNKYFITIFRKTYLKYVDQRSQRKLMAYILKLTLISDSSAHKRPKLLNKSKSELFSTRVYLRR